MKRSHSKIIFLHSAETGTDPVDWPYSFANIAKGFVDIATII